ncbi:MAG: ABC transporter ATP-binding protein [Mycobacteriales bacterium]
MSAVLELDRVSVRFGGLHAVDDVSLRVLGGQVTGLIGPNGAGKTTTFNVVTGLQRPTHGTVRLAGQDVTGLAPHKGARLGMARTFQRLEVFGTLSARDNVLVATEAHHDLTGEGPDPRHRADALLEQVGAGHVAGERADTLPTGLARLVELARALATEPSVLLLDEPGSGLGAHETEALGDLLLDLAATGMAILLVEHDVELVMRVCAHLTVLDFGQTLATGTVAEIQQDERVRAAYLGAAL